MELYRVDNDKGENGDKKERDVRNSEKFVRETTLKEVHVELEDLQRRALLDAREHDQAVLVRLQLREAQCGGERES